MRAWALKIAPTAAAWIALTVIASAGPLTSEADTPTGDVWIATDAPRPAPPQAAQNILPRRELPTGDFWPVQDGAARAADAPALPRGQAAASEGGVASE